MEPGRCWPCGFATTVLSHTPNSCGAAPESCHSSFFVHVALWLLHCSRWNHKYFIEWIQMGLTANESSRFGSITNQLLEDEWTSVASRVFKSHEVHFKRQDNRALFWFRKSNFTTLVGIKRSRQWTRGGRSFSRKTEKIVGTLSFFFFFFRYLFESKRFKLSAIVNPV